MLAVHWKKRFFLGLMILLPSLAVNAAERINGIYVGKTPEPILLPFEQARQLANTEASHTPGALVVRGSGHSMQPLFLAGNILVVVPVEYAQLSAGSTVLYYNKRGHPVMHVLVANAKPGWRATGLNNEVEDDDFVTPDNLVGIVSKAYQPNDNNPIDGVLKLASAASILAASRGL